jgi:predicted DNA-binding WGR domain protein
VNVVKRYELKTKFWSTRVDGNELHVAWGKIGTAGQSKVTTFATQDEALAEAALRARDKVKEGYVEVVQASAGVAASTSKGGSTSDTIPLRYVIADDDVEDDVTLSVAWPGTATAFGETMPIALDGAGIWVFSQESRMPDDPTWSPPFLVPARVADALAAGNTTTVATGFDRDRLHVFVRCELDALSEEAREDASRWSGPKVAARTDEGAELVFALAATPQLLVLRHDDACEVVWQSGELPGSNEPRANEPRANEPRANEPRANEPRANVAKGAKPASKAKGAKVDPLAVVFDDAAPEAERVKALKTAFKSPTAALVERGTFEADRWPEPLRKAWFGGINGARHTLETATPRWDPIDALELAVERAGDVPLPAEVSGYDARVNPILSFLASLPTPYSPRAEALVRRIAWEIPRGEASVRAREWLVRLGDADSRARVADLLTAPHHASMAVEVLLTLPDGAAKARTQLAGLTSVPYEIASAFHGLIHHAPNFDVAAWFDILDATVQQRDRFTKWVAMHRVHRAAGRLDAATARWLASEYFCWRDADLAIELATFPPEALDASVLQVALGFATSFDVSPVLLAAPRELARAAVEAAIAESGDDPPEVLTDLRVRLA